MLATVHVAAGGGSARADAARLLEATIALTARELPRFGIACARGSPSPASIRMPASTACSAARRRTVIAPGDRRVPRAAASTSPGPFPADTVFVRATRGEFDVVVACYHDQGLIPVKLVGVRPGGERDARPADRPDVGRSRHGVRHRRQGRGRPRQHDRGGAAGGEPGRRVDGTRVRRRTTQDASQRSTNDALDFSGSRMVMKEKTERELAQANIAENRKAFHDYHLLETFEAGIALLGTEVKAIREGRVNLRDSFARVDDGEVFLYNVNISPYSHRGYADHEPLRAPQAAAAPRRDPEADRQDGREGDDARAGPHVLQERPRQGGGQPGEGQEGVRQARDDQAARGRSRDPRGGQEPPAMISRYNRPT